MSKQNKIYSLIESGKTKEEIFEILKKENNFVTQSQQESLKSLIASSYKQYEIEHSTDVEKKEKDKDKLILTQKTKLTELQKENEELKNDIYFLLGWTPNWMEDEIDREHMDESVHKVKIIRQKVNYKNGNRS